MPRIAYIDKTFRAQSATVIAQANTILTKYSRAGYDMTLRQVYYQFIALDLFPEDRRWRWTGAKWVRDPNGTKNAEPNYNWLGEIVNDARLAGLMDWNFLVDRTRELQSVSHWESPSSIMDAVASQFRIDKWETQPFRPEIWVEKEALAGIFERVCRRLDVALFACRGYTSQSEMWRAAQRLKGYARAGQTPIIFHFGDHDPSGIDMSRDIDDRLKLFMGGMEINRLALNMDQVNEFQPPPSPAKITDSRAASYIDLYGDESWELDALEPDKMVELVTTAIEGIREESEWTLACQKEEEQRAALRAISNNFEMVQAYTEESGWLAEELGGESEEDGDE